MPFVAQRKPVFPIFEVLKISHIGKNLIGRKNKLISTYFKCDILLHLRSEVFSIQNLMALHMFLNFVKATYETCFYYQKH